MRSASPEVKGRRWTGEAAGDGTSHPALPPSSCKDRVQRPPSLFPLPGTRRMRVGMAGKVVCVCVCVENSFDIIT